MKTKALKTVAIVLCFSMMFATIANPAFAQASEDFEILHSEEIVPLTEIAENLEPFATPASSFATLGGFGLGDVDGSGRVTSADATMIARWLITPEVQRDALFPNFNRRAADIGLSGEININSVNLLARALVGQNVAVGAQPNSITILTYSNCMNLPIYNAEIGLYINNQRRTFNTQTGIISIPNIPAGSNVRVTVTADPQIYCQFAIWRVIEGNVALPRLALAPEFVMPGGEVVLSAEVLSVAQYYFGSDVSPEWDDDLANVFIPMEWGALAGGLSEWNTLSDAPLRLFATTTGQALEYQLYFPETEVLEIEIPEYDRYEYMLVEGGIPKEYPPRYTELTPYFAGQSDIEPFICITPHNAFITLSRNQWLAPAYESYMLVQVTSNTTWSVSRPNLPWLDFEQIGGTGNGWFWIDVTRNTGAASRTGILTVSGAGFTNRSVTVTQQGGAALDLFVGDIFNPPALTASANLNIARVGVLSSRLWNVSSNAPSWLFVEEVPANRVGNGAFAIVVQPNLGNTTRTGRITVTSEGLTRHIDITQQTGAVLLVRVYDREYLPPGPVTATTEVVSNRAWTAVVNPVAARSWLSVTPASHTNSGSLHIHTTANLGNASRQGTITVTVAGLPPFTFTVIQQAGAVLMVTPPPATAPPNAVFNDIAVTSNRAWSVTVNPAAARSWISVTPASGNNNGVFGVYLQENTTNAQRSGTITVSGGGITRNIPITQQRPTATLSLSTNVWRPTSTGGSVTASVTSSAAWTAATSEPWLSVTPTSRPGSGTIAINAATNPTNSERTGRIFITAGNMIRIFWVIQGAGGTLSVQRTEWNPTSARSQAYASVNTTGAWTVSVGVNARDWLSVDDVIPVYRPGTGRFRMHATPNPNPGSRTGTIIISGSGVTRHITVTQAGGGQVLLGRFSWTEEPDEWFLLQNAVRHAGGVTIPLGDGITRSEMANVFGTSTTFVVNGTDVLHVYGRGIAIRADVFYYRIVRAAGGEMVFLGGHRAFGGHHALLGSLHTYVKMFVTPNSSHWNNRYFGQLNDFENRERGSTTRWGVQYATLGGFASLPYTNMRLLIVGNAQYDLKFYNTTLKIHLSSGTGAITNLLNARDSQGEGWIYGSLFVPGVDGPHISNNILSGLLHATGLHPGALPQMAPGWNQPTPSSFFGR